VQIAGKWVNINPREWKNRFDFNVNVGLGTGNKDQVVQHLMALMDAQGKGLQIGIANPKNLYNSASKLAENLGFKQADDFFTDPSQQQPQQPQPSPEQIKAQAKTEIQAAESERRKSINSLFQPAFMKLPGVSEMRDDCLADMNVSAQLASDRLMKKLGESMEPTASKPAVISMGESEFDKFLHQKIEFYSYMSQDKLEKYGFFNGKKYELFDKIKESILFIHEDYVQPTINQEIKSITNIEEDKNGNLLYWIHYDYHENGVLAIEKRSNGHKLYYNACGELIKEEGNPNGWFASGILSASWTEYECEITIKEDKPIPVNEKKKAKIVNHKISHQHKKFISNRKASFNRRHF